MAILFLIWLCIAASSDVVYRKSFNWIVILGLILAFFSVGVKPESHPINLCFIDSFFGFFLAFFWLFLYFLYFINLG